MIYGGYFEPDKTLTTIKSLEAKMNEPTFWDDKDTSSATIKELNHLKNKYNDISKLRTHINENIDILVTLKESYDDEMFNLIENEQNEISTKLDNLEVENLLNGPYDKNDCILEIHPGAGGTESCDWANMLYRMYTRYCENHNYKITILDYQAGDEAGIKSVSLLIKGINAYGYLKNEKGVHRLVRLSPFDSNNRRHTSFASVEVTPDIDKDVDVEIDDKDLKIDVYRSTGAGGQGVNTTDSAVRITHIPSKIVDRKRVV